MTYQQFAAPIRPTDMDVLCGRGKAFSKHPGNVKFAATIQSYLQKYRDAPRRIDRSLLVASLVEKIFDGGTRFLKKNKTADKWIELNADQRHEKVGHALRDLHRKTKYHFFKQPSQSTQAMASIKTTMPQNNYFTLPTPTDPINVISEEFKPNPFLRTRPSEVISSLVLKEFEPDPMPDIPKLIHFFTEEKENTEEPKTDLWDRFVSDADDGSSLSDPFDIADDDSIAWGANTHTPKFLSSNGYFDDLQNRPDLSLEADLSNFEF